ncbi:MAG: insulinase family protein [Bacteroidales bacterium]|nr:insulinase family protein [Bacteroidales bacterium]MCF8388622.1 insulinase family protein [Bacteroidales bacterium]MCF8399368.1 insulinase family protein [Bacteroidales bacterium]
MDYQEHRLDNGVRLIHKSVKSEVSHLAWMLNAGTRDEHAGEAGIAHFIEHVIFKGTRKRKAYHVLSRMENVGGDLNAYTTKEETVVFNSFLNPHYERAIELLADIVSNSTFPEKEVIKERDVVIDEINHYKDTPSEEIYDEFEGLLFDGHPLGKNILGTPNDVMDIDKNKILSFIDNHYHTDRMLIASVGNIPFGKLVLLVEKHFGEMQERVSEGMREKFSAYIPKNRQERRNTFLSHGCIGNLAYSHDDKKRLDLVLLNNLLGGPGMNSRLNLAIREKYGFTYMIDSQYLSYSDTGVFCIYLGTDKGYMERSIRLVHQELKKLREKKLGTLQLKRAKQQIIGQMAISLESNQNRMLAAGKSYLHLNRVNTFKELSARIENISALELLEVANEIFDPGQISTLVYQSNNSKHD